MSQYFRLPTGGHVDRTRTLRFRFDGRTYSGHPGDTLASALLANGVRLVGRSFKLHRPRGIYSAGVEEPNALVELRTGARREPNTRMTVTELYDGLEAAIVSPAAIPEHRQRVKGQTLRIGLIAETDGATIQAFVATVIPREIKERSVFDIARFHVGQIGNLALCVVDVLNACCRNRQVCPCR